MAQCSHIWEMNNLRRGFAVFEKCAHCQKVRTYFSDIDTWDEYREGDCTWSIVENSQTIHFDLHCSRCGAVEQFSDLLGLMSCTSCMEDCEVERIRKKFETERTWILVAFGNVTAGPSHAFPQPKLDILSQYFNQRRDTSRSRIRIVSSDLIPSVPLFEGDFLLDFGTLSLEPPSPRKQLF
jgi:hypothetical protein